MWYDVRGVLSSGSFVINYAGFDGNLDQEVVIKEFFPSDIVVRGADGSVQPRSPDKQAQLQHGFHQFLTEARIIAKLKHLCIVDVLSMFEANNTGYVVMAHLKGSTLGDYLQTHAANEDALKRLLATLLDGLQIIHEAEFYHLALRPENIILDNNGTPVLTGFGAARQSYARRARALKKVLMPGYAAVEQYARQSGKQGSSTDIYALAAIVYEAIVGHTPIPSLERMKALEGGADPYQPLSQLGSGRYSAGFLQAIDWALAYHRTQRPQSVAEWRTALQLDKLSGKTAPAQHTAAHSEFHEEPILDEAPPPEATVVEEPKRKRNVVWPLLGVTLLIAIIVGVYLAYRYLDIAAITQPTLTPEAAPPAIEANQPARPVAPIDDQVARLQGPNPEALRRLQIAEVALQIAENPADYELAVKELQQALALDENLPRTYLLLSQAYEQLGDSAAAERHLARYRELGGD